jgi:sialidase-1
MTHPASTVVVTLNHGPGNPRNSEGAFVDLRDGRILYAYTRYCGQNWDDDAVADIVGRTSVDGGRTWSAADRLIIRNDGALNVMSVSLLRLADGRLAMFNLRKDGVNACIPFLRTSQDEGETWSASSRCIATPGYFVLNNDRVVALRSGRLVMPVAYHRPCCVRQGGSSQVTEDGRALAVFYLSDDQGASWYEAPDVLPLPVRSGTGLQEPGVVELADGRLWAWFRTDTGVQWQSFCRDGGMNWSWPEPSVFQAPTSPLSMKRDPFSGDLVAVWNDRSGRWGLPAPEQSSWGRTPLVLAWSRDEGATWERARVLEDDPARGFCYIALHFTREAILLAYCCGGRGGGVLQDSCIRLLDRG